MTISLERIKVLGDKLRKVKEEIIKLENEYVFDKDKVFLKDQEIKNLRNTLTTYSRERDDIQKVLDNKVKELENSNLSNDEKQKQINQILVESKNELNLVNQNLMETWTSYNIQRDKMLEYLIKPCNTCEIKNEAILDLSRVRNGLFAAVIFLLTSLFLGGAYLVKKTINSQKKKKILIGVIK